MALGYRLSQALYVFAELGLADVLSRRPEDVTAIAERVGAHQGALLRVLRVSRAMGLVDELPNKAFRLTTRGQLLRKDADGSMWPRVRSVGDSWHWDSWGHLLQTVTSGKPAFAAEYGLNSFDYFNQTPGAGDTMMNRVTVEARVRGAAVAGIVDFSSARCLADVGGGRGAVLAEVLSRHPHLRGVLFDLPYAVDGAAQLLEDLGVADRCEVVAGDFRLDLPAGADIYLLAAVVHSWDDDDSAQLLRRCFTQVDRVLVLDEVIEPETASMDALLKDLQLMIFSGGRQRGLQEYRRLFERAGGQLVEHTAVGKQELLMEARPGTPRA